MYFSVVGVHIGVLVGEGEVKLYFFLCTHTFKCENSFADYLVYVKTAYIKHHSLTHIVQRKKTYGKLIKTFCFKKHNVEIFFIHLRRNGSVQHRLKIALYRGEWGAEVMGDVGYELILVVIKLFNFTCHEVK